MSGFTLELSLGAVAATGRGAAAEQRHATGHNEKLESETFSHGGGSYPRAGGRASAQGCAEHSAHSDAKPCPRVGAPRSQTRVERFDEPCRSRRLPTLAGPVHQITEGDARIRIGEPERTTVAVMAERVRAGSQRTSRLCQLETESESRGELRAVAIFQ